MNNEDQPQVKAIKEALVNLLMHTDYFSNAKPRIRVFLDRIEFFNPGSLPKDVKYIMQEEFSMPRNRTVARIFRHIGLSENIGSGFDKMFKGWTSYYKHKPKVSGDFDYYKIVFSLETKTARRIPESIPENVPESIPEKVTEKQKRILEIMAANRYVPMKEIAEKVGIAERNIKIHIKKLKEMGKLKRVGPDRGGHWEVVQK
jgi:ATP-dependent DNA helicase RecG